MQVLCAVAPRVVSVSFFFFNDTATTEIYTLSLHDALPISHRQIRGLIHQHLDALLALVADPHPKSLRAAVGLPELGAALAAVQDRKSTRLNSSHSQISYAGFCFKKKNKESRRSHSLQ